MCSWVVLDWLPSRCGSYLVLQSTESNDFYSKTEGIQAMVLGTLFQNRGHTGHDFEYFGGPGILRFQLLGFCGQSVCYRVFAPHPRSYELTSSSRCHKQPRGSKYPIFEVSGPKNQKMVWFLEPETSKCWVLGAFGQCTDTQEALGIQKAC